MTFRVGVCEDDPSIRRVLREVLEREGHDVVLAHNAGEAMRLFVDRDLDVVVLDVGLPDADGRDLCQALRAAGQAAPVLFVTALDARHDKIAGFVAGGDDYVTKPFDLTEVVLRVQALARRAASPASASGLVLDPLRHALRHGEREVSLTPTEFRVLAALMARPGEVVRRAGIVAAGWPHGAMVSDNMVDAFIRRLRIKLAAVDAPMEIHTHRGVGVSLR